MRRYKRHLKRTCIPLDGHWAFRTDRDDRGVAEQWYTAFPEPERTVYVPGCWNNEIGLYDYEGPAWYQTTFDLAAAGEIALVFQAVSGQADVYINGNHAGAHYGGFTAFTIRQSGLAAGKHTLVVRVDNTHDEQTIPLARVDWFHYGGIFRPVELQLLPRLYIGDLEISYELVGRDAEVGLHLKLAGAGQAGELVPVAIKLDGELVHETEVIWPAGEKSVDVRIRQQWDNLQLWGPDHPVLYEVGVQLEGDDYTQRIGFRTVEVKDGRLLLNGQLLELQGVNRHEEHPDWGFAFPPGLMGKELDIVQRLGCNSVRGSHYPQSEYWLDLLDERGIVFWSELPLWQYHPQHMTDPIVRERAVTMLEEMIAEGYHHPATLFWSVHNECDTNTPEGLAFTKLLVEKTRELDPSRMVTFATHHALNDQTLALFDVIGINEYYGWYEGETAQFETFLEAYHAYAETVGAGHIPVIMAEFGAAGIFGDAGWETNRLFSEDAQAEVVVDALRIFKRDPRVIGTFIWQYADIRSDARTFRDRARSFNNKGLVNEYRKPKLAYREVQRMYLQGGDHDDPVQ